MAMTNRARKTLTDERKTEILEIRSMLRVALVTLERAEREDQVDYALSLVREAIKRR